MKQIILLLTVTLCMLQTLAGVITHSETFAASGWDLQAVTVDTTQYTRVEYSGLDYISEPGKPQLPVKYVRLMVPYNATNISVNCTCGAATAQILSSKVLPAEEPQIADETASATPIIHEDSALYSNDAQFPSSLGEIVADGYLMGDNHVITVALYPMQYNPVTGVATSYTTLSATVTYDLGAAPANVLHRHNAKAQNEDLTMLADVVENPTQIQAFKAPARPNYTQGDNAISPLVESYDYTIITTRELKPAFKRLIALKRQKGYSAGAVCIEDIMQNPNVNGGDSIFDANNNLVSVIADSAGVIRQYLKRAFENGTRYVLMGGKQVPYRYGDGEYTKFIRKNTYDTIHCQIPTDMYFADLNSNWIYYSPSVYKRVPNNNNSQTIPVGRLLAVDDCDITNYISKLLQYEFNPGGGDFSYLNRAYFYEANEFISHSKRVRDPLSLINDTITYETEMTSTSAPTGKSIVDRINDQYGFISIHAHGNPNGLMVSNSGTHKHMLNALEGQWVISNMYQYLLETGNGLDNLNNKYYPNIYYSTSCETMPYDIYSMETFTYNVKRNFGDSFISGKDYGGVAFLGYTRDGIMNNSEIIEKNFINEILSGNWKIGIAEANSKFNYNGSCRDLLINGHNLLGDPEVEIWTDSPSTYDAVNILRTNNAISVSGNFNNHTIISYCDGVSQHETRPSNGTACFDGVSPNGSVMIYEHNYIPYISPLAIQNCNIVNSQYVIASDAIIGRDIDPNRTPGNVTIKIGANYEIESKGNVCISSHFTVEKGASFGIYPASFK